MEKRFDYFADRSIVTTLRFLLATSDTFEQLVEMAVILRSFGYDTTQPLITRITPLTEESGGTREWGDGFLCFLQPFGHGSILLGRIISLGYE